MINLSGIPLASFGLLWRIVDGEATPKNSPKISSGGSNCGCRFEERCGILPRMLAALLAVVLFSMSGVAGERTARYWGGQQGNLLRLFFATLLMWSVTLIWFRESLRAETFGWLFFSGIVGFGLGDIALFLAYVRIGARLTILLNLCTAPVWGALLEWLWLGTILTGTQFAAGALILGGVSLALLAQPLGPGRGSRAIGILCGLAAGCGQGMGAVISRKAFEVAGHAGFSINGFSAAAQRVSGGFLTALTLMVVLSATGAIHSRFAAITNRRRACLWLATTTLCGPVLGVSCFQWSLLDLPAAITMALVATTPIAMIPLTMLLEREQPRALSIVGSLLAVAGVVWMVMLRH